MVRSVFSIVQGLLTATLVIVLFVQHAHIQQLQLLQKQVGAQAEAISALQASNQSLGVQVGNFQDQLDAAKNAYSEATLRLDKDEAAVAHLQKSLGPLATAFAPATPGSLRVTHLDPTDAGRFDRLEKRVTKLEKCACIAPDSGGSL